MHTDVLKTLCAPIDAHTHAHAHKHLCLLERIDKHQNKSASVCETPPHYLHNRYLLLDVLEQKLKESMALSFYLV